MLPGWRAVFHAEILSAGLAAHDGPSFRMQRQRWTHGAVQVLIREKLVTRPGLTLRQRGAYLTPVFGILESWREALWYVLPAAILLTGLSPLRSDAGTYALYFVPYFLALTLAYNEIARGHGRLIETGVFNLARCTTAFAAVAALRPENRRFRVTPKTRGPRTDAFGDTFPWLVVALTFAGITVAAGGMLSGRSGLPAGTLVIVGTWAAFNALTAGRLLLLARRTRRNRRAATRFRCSFRATIAHVDAPATYQSVEVVAATADGFTLRTQAGTGVLAAGRYQGTLDLAGTDVPFAIGLREPGGERLAGGAVTWRDPVARAAFDLALHQLAIGRLAAADRGDRDGVLAAAFERLDLSGLSAVLRRCWTPPARRARGSLDHLPAPQTKGNA